MYQSDFEINARLRAVEQEVHSYRTPDVDSMSYNDASGKRDMLHECLKGIRRLRAKLFSASPRSIPVRWNSLK